MRATERKTASPKAMLDGLGLSPRKRLGQHFLVGSGVVNMIVRAADIKPGETVVEVGPGLGILTRELVEKAGRVVAVEMDKEMAEVLDREVNSANLEVVPADARQVGVKGDNKCHALQARGQPPLLCSESHTAALSGIGVAAGPGGRNGAKGSSKADGGTAGRICRWSPSVCRYTESPP